MSANSTNTGMNSILETPQQIDLAVALDVLKTGNVELYGLMPWSSNYTFLGLVSKESVKFNVIYKPVQGERPLWDFEQNTLCNREVAAYEVSQALNNQVAVPPTVLSRGPHGQGSLQQFIHADYDVHYFTLKDDPQYKASFQELAVFDYLVNNADRKGGHCLLDRHNKIWAIDHGLTFHTNHKLKTVIWEFANQQIPVPLHTKLEAFKRNFTPSSKLYRTLQNLISRRELEQFCRRLDNLLKSGKFPRPLGRRDYPYPPV